MTENRHCCCHHRSAVPSVVQTLGELDFERGLWYAALTGDIERIQNLLRQGKDPNGVDSSGYTALHYAARNGYPKVCQLLLNAGACVNASTRCGGATPLHRAAYSGEVEIVNIFLGRPECLVLHQDVDGKTCLHKAVEKKHWNIADLLIQKYPSLAHISDKSGKVPADYISIAPNEEVPQGKIF